MASRTCGATTKVFTSVSSESQEKIEDEIRRKKKLEEITTENLPNLARDINLEIQEDE